MAIMNEVERGKVLIGKLGYDCDLLEEITETCRRADIRLGRIQAIGAVRKARLAYYNQEQKTYEFYEFDEPMEILSLTGNVSLKEGQPIVHAHLVLSSKKGASFGGHLAAGTVVFACECIIEELTGQVYERGLDETTGLPLWEL